MSIALTCRTGEPVQRLCMITRDGTPQRKGHAQMVLRGRVILCGGQMKPVKRGGRIGRAAKARVEHGPQAILRLGLTAKRVRVQNAPRAFMFTRTIGGHPAFSGRAGTIG